VSALENTLAQLLQSGNLASNVSAETPVHRTIADDEERDDDGDDDANQFVAGATALDDVSLSSQVAAMRALIYSPLSPGPGPSSRRPTNTKAGLLVRLPDPGSMQHLFDVYFRDLDNYFPFLDRQELEPRMYRVIRRLGYSAQNTVILVHVDDTATIALMCIMMAIAECIDPSEGVCDGERKPGWERYLMFRRAMQRLFRSGPLDLDVVRAQAIAATYLMHCEALEAASQAVAVAWQLAVSIRLNNQKVWPKREAKETLERQQLWWTIYFLDRQISRRSGIPYHIRDTEFDVDDFTGNETTVDGGPERLSLYPSTNSKGYMQGLINLARLWGNVWDTFFAVGATKTGDWMEVEIMDARILNTCRQLPDTLTWDPNNLASYTRNGEDELHLRRRLQLYTVGGTCKSREPPIPAHALNNLAETRLPSHAHPTEPRAPSGFLTRNRASLFSLGASDHRSSWHLHLTLPQCQSDRLLYHELNRRVHIPPGSSAASLQGRGRACRLRIGVPPRARHPSQDLILQQRGEQGAESPDWRGQQVVQQRQ
jgi:hypothetical protein